MAQPSTRKGANALEREVNLYKVAAARYAIPRPEGHLLVELVEAIRGAEDNEFLATWQDPAEPSPSWASRQQLRLGGAACLRRPWPTNSAWPR